MAVRTYAVIKAGAARRRLAISILSGACLGHFAFTFYIMFSAGKVSQLRAFEGKANPLTINPLATGKRCQSSRTTIAVSLPNWGLPWQS